MIASPQAAVHTAGNGTGPANQVYWGANVASDQGKLDHGSTHRGSGCDRCNGNQMYGTYSTTKSAWLPAHALSPDESIHVLVEMSSQPEDAAAQVAGGCSSSVE